MTAPSSRAPLRVGAFFDFDRTVIDADAGVLFGHEMYRIIWRRILEDRPGTLGWLGRIVRFVSKVLWLTILSVIMRLLHLLRLVKRSTVVRMAYRSMKGLDEADVRRLAKDFFDEVISLRIFPGAANRIRHHHREGHVIVVATTNMQVLVENVGRRLPVDHVVGTVFVVGDGKLTGKVSGPTYGNEKAQAIRAWAHANGVSLPKSHGYTDHYSDHEFLGLFGHPHVVNGNFRMRRLARRKGWDRISFEPAPGPSA